MKATFSKLQEFVGTQVETRLSPKTSANLLLKAFGIVKVPLLFATNPKVVEISDSRLEVKIPLTKITKNHLDTMYFGALAIGADCAVGLLAVHHIRKRRRKDIHLSFKDFQAEFLKRPDGDVHFICEHGVAISEFIDSVITSGERMNLSIPAYATVPSKAPQEPVARFTLTLSLKRK